MMRHTALGSSVILLLAVAGITSAYAAAAQDYPSKPVRLIVPYPPGGGNDTLARLFGAKLTEAWGHQVIVDNRGGAVGTLGSEIGSRATPDGYTLTMGVSGFPLFGRVLLPGSLAGIIAGYRLAFSRSWRILVAEIMLQQTQALRVIPKWLAFGAAYPTPAACACPPA